MLSGQSNIRMFRGGAGRCNAGRKCLSPNWMRESVSQSWPLQAAVNRSAEVTSPTVGAGPWSQAQPAETPASVTSISSIKNNPNLEEAAVSNLFPAPGKRQPAGSDWNLANGFDWRCGGGHDAEGGDPTPGHRAKSRARRCPRRFEGAEKTSQPAYSSELRPERLGRRQTPERPLLARRTLDPQPILIRFRSRRCARTMTHGLSGKHTYLR